MKFQQNPMGQTALHVAASRNLLSICKLLIIFGFDVNHKDIAGRTALFFAVKYNYREVVVTLVANFSSCFVIDKYNQSLIHAATDPIMKLIVEKGKIY
jgi:ankyrin repeat protein